jgi:copper chaperone CopZ
MKSYQVLNVKCGGCANTLKSKLEEDFGKVDVNLDVMPREITIDQEEIDENKLRDVLKSIGYPMSDEDLNFFEEVRTKATSFVSCAIGKTTP